MALEEGGVAEGVLESGTVEFPATLGTGGGIGDARAAVCDSLGHGIGD